MIRPPARRDCNQANTYSSAARASLTSAGSGGVSRLAPAPSRADILGAVPMPSRFPRTTIGQSAPTEVRNTAYFRLEEPEFYTSAKSSTLHLDQYTCGTCL